MLLRPLLNPLSTQLLIVFGSSQNFAISAASAQLPVQFINDPAGLRSVGQSFDKVDIFFTTVFTAELAVNLFAHWLWPFVTSGW
jgi:hypothetical protein